MAQHQALFEWLFNQNYCLLLTQEAIELVGVPPASPGELQAGWALEERRGLAILRGGHLVTIYIIVVSVFALLFSPVYHVWFAQTPSYSYALYAYGFLSIIHSLLSAPQLHEYKLYILPWPHHHTLCGAPFDGESLRIPSRLSHSTCLYTLSNSFVSTLSNISFLFVFNFREHLKKWFWKLCFFPHLSLGIDREASCASERGGLTS